MTAIDAATILFYLLQPPAWRLTSSHRTRRVEIGYTNERTTSQRQRLFLREALAKGKHADRDFTPADKLEQHCLRADKVYSQWAYQDILGYHFPEE